MESLAEQILIAPCGMNCGICMAFLREKNRCSGCRGDDSKKPVTRKNCKIKNCKIFQNNKAAFCYECQDFPCEKLAHLDKRYRTRYSMGMIENLTNVKNSGLGKFLEDQKKRWTCPECKGIICVHTGSCQNCGKSSGSKSTLK